ncbi:MAG: glutathione S-transferase [Rhodoferax sp.]|nr:glutathione S-transferase [Rhodoferax sp.]
MKLHWSPRSPFVRKVVIVLLECGLRERVEFVRSVVAMAEPNLALMRDNPLSQIPTLVRDDGAVLYDSPLICEYLDTLHDGAPMCPPSGAARWLTLRRQALADGLLAVLLLWRQERIKTQVQQEPTWLAAFRLKIDIGLAALEGEADSFDAVHLDIGQIAIGCMLSYLDYRFADFNWRAPHPCLAAWHAQFSQRPSVLASVPDDTAT